MQNAWAVWAVHDHVYSLPHDVASWCLCQLPLSEQCAVASRVSVACATASPAGFSAWLIELLPIGRFQGLGNAPLGGQDESPEENAWNQDHDLDNYIKSGLTKKEAAQAVACKHTPGAAAEPLYFVQASHLLMFSRTPAYTRRGIHSCQVCRPGCRWHDVQLRRFLPAPPPSP